MRKDVEHYVKHCRECQLYKAPQTAPARLMGLRKIEGPWTNVATDIFGPLPTSRGTNNRYIIVFADLFTKYVELRTLRKANAKTVLKDFEVAVVYKWGCPKFLISDNGSEYKNKLVKRKIRYRS